MPKSVKTVATPHTITFSADTAVATLQTTDTADSAHISSTDTLHQALLISPVEQLHTSAPRTGLGENIESWLLLLLLILLSAIGLKFRNSTRYIALLAREIANTRKRHNVFEDTVRETSFLLLLNVVTLLSGGLLLGMALSDNAEITFSHTVIGMGAAGGYGIFMWLAYNITAHIFTDRTSMKIWVRGHSAAQGLLSLVLLPLALAAVATNDYEIAQQILWVGVCFFCIAKLIFIFKSIRIFITDFNSCVLFFYYLCSLEIVPLILTYTAARNLCLEVV